jgi:hypothetical protein
MENQLVPHALFDTSELSEYGPTAASGEVVECFEVGERVFGGHLELEYPFLARFWIPALPGGRGVWVYRSGEGG